MGRSRIRRPRPGRRQPGRPISSPPAAVTEPGGAPALSIAKSATPTSVDAVGQTVTYHFTVTNTGNVDLTDVQVTDTQTAAGGCAGVGADVPDVGDSGGTCSGASTSLAPGQSATFTATYTVTQADLINGSIKDSATATGTPPIRAADTTSPPSTAVTVPRGGVAPAPGLSMTKSATPTSVNAVGQTVTYHFTATNRGNVDLTNVHVNDTQHGAGGCAGVGADVPVVGESGGYVLGFLDVAPTGSVGDVHRDLHGDAGRSQPWVDQGSATATGTPPTGPDTTSPPSTATVTAASIARLTLTKVVDRQRAFVGDLLHYKIVVVNHGPDAANDVVVHDTPSLPMTVVSVHTSVGHCSVTHGDDVTCHLGRLANGGRVTITVAAYALAVGTEVDTAKATTTSHNSNPGGAIGHASTKIVSPLSLTKTANPTTITTGQSVTFTITVKNLSSRTLNNVLVCDTLPAELLYVSSDPAVGAPRGRAAVGRSGTCLVTRPSRSSWSPTRRPATATVPSTSRRSRSTACPPCTRAARSRSAARRCSA